MLQVIKRIVGTRLFEVVEETEKEVVVFNATAIITQGRGLEGKNSITEIELVDGVYSVYNRGNRVTVHKKI